MASRKMLAAGLVLVSFAPLDTAGAADVAMIRGSQAATEVPASGGAITVLRGKPAASPAMFHPLTTLEASPTAAIVAGGSNLWVVDRQGEVTGCWLRGSGYVGGLTVVCTRRP